MSNLALLFLVPLTTVMVMRIRNGMCKRSPSLLTKYAVDLSYIMVTNILAVSSIVIWCTLLNTPFENIMAIDLVFGIGPERWLMNVITSYDGTSYHPGGAIGNSMIRQRMRLSCVIAIVLRGHSAAAAVVAEERFGVGAALAPTTTCMLLPMLYATVRAIALDIDAYQPGMIRIRDCTASALEFTITDEEEEEALSDEGDGHPQTSM